MTGNFILSQIKAIESQIKAIFRRKPDKLPDLHNIWLDPGCLPKWAQTTPVVQRTLDLLGPLNWGQLPERNLERNWGQEAVSYAAFAGAMLVKLNERQESMGDLCRYLIEHPALISMLGFHTLQSRRYPCGFDPEASLPTPRHLTRLLREMPNDVLQFLLGDTVRLIREELDKYDLAIGDCISLDTKHILAWVKENNPKVYVEQRLDKTKQPKGDPDCKLGCKRKHNKKKGSPQVAEVRATPTTNPLPGEGLKFGDFYWGYGSGIVVTRIPTWGELVLAELTQPFNQADISYFFPLMTITEQRLGFRPRFAAFDAAFDAWYIYAFFHRDDDPLAFAAIPFSEKGGYKEKGRSFSQDGLPICAAGLPMPLHFTYSDRTTCILEHQRGKYVCPLRYPQRSSDTCPVNHFSWAKNGCTANMPTSIGARLRYTLDRDSPIYQDIYNQRTATERINSQAKALGIERPHIRNGKAIANLNSLIYILINLRVLRRIRNRQLVVD